MSQAKKTDPRLSDEELIEAVLENQELYREVMYRYQEKLSRYVLTLVGDASDADDVVQNTFIKAFKNLQSFDVHRKFSSWIYRIAHNEAVNSLRKQKWAFSLEEVWVLGLGGREDEVEQDFFKKENQKRVREALQQIPVKYRGPVTLYFLEGYSYEEISEILRVSSNTVATWLRRGKQQLAELLKEES